MGTARRFDRGAVRLRIAPARIAMNPTRRIIALAAASASALALASGCALLMPEPAPYVAQADQIGVYEASPPGPRAYRFVKRLWVEPWQSAISVPRYASVEAGAADLRNQAVALGGDAIVNFGCYHSGRDAQPALHSALHCNGTVIKYVQ